MRQTQIFAGSSHPELVDSICARLGSNPAKAELGKFSNGETKVQLNTSIREQDVFIVQSGGDKINDDLVELLIMCSACKSGSAKSVTAVMPYFPYSRQSKKKSHRGAITARMVANLLDVAGVNHVITIDLHASQMQGFFRCPVDNLVAEPLIAHWIKVNVPEWRTAVVVSKNPGGTKRVTSLADALKLNFGIVMTDRARRGSGRTSIAASMILEPPTGDGIDGFDDQTDSFGAPSVIPPPDRGSIYGRHLTPNNSNSATPARIRPDTNGIQRPSTPRITSSQPNGDNSLTRIQTAPSAIRRDSELDSTDDDIFDPRIRDVVTGRLIHGHIVDDDAPSPSISASASSAILQDDSTVPDHMLSSTASLATTATYASSSITRTNTHTNGTSFLPRFYHNNSNGGNSSSTHTLNGGGGHGLGLGGSGDAAASDDEEDQLLHPELESTVTLVGNVRDRVVFIVDDMIDKSASWIAAAETVVKRGGATKVYCMATHGIFGDECLREMEECECIEGIVVTNSIPLPEQVEGGVGGSGGNNGGYGYGRRTGSKLRVLDVSGLLAEAIRRTRHGESIERLYIHYE